MRFQRPFGTLALVSILVNLLAGTLPAQTQTTQTKPVEGLIFALREAPSAPTLPERKPVVRSLDDGAVRSVTDRLPPFLEKTSETREPLIAPGDLRVPKSNTVVVPLKLTEPNLPTAVDRSQSLEVVRFSPSGATSIATELSVTFSQAMVPVGSQSETAAIAPVRISPEVRGRWRWVGTRTVVFDAEGRFPMAAEFNVTVPRGTRSLSGAELQASVEWKFSTPPPATESVFPSTKTASPNSIIFAKFNQKIDQSAILALTSVFADGRQVAIRPATDEEIRADKSLSPTFDQIPRDRLVIFRAVEPLPSDAAVEVRFAAGLPSAEGPKKSETAASHQFRTYGSMRLDAFGCGWQKDSNCDETDGVSLKFSNPIDRDSFDESYVTVEPPAGEISSLVYGDSIYVNADFKANETYRITVLPKFKDTFGQTLAAPVSEKLKFRRAAVSPSLMPFDGDREFMTLDPYAKRYAFSVFSRRYQTLRTKVYSVTSADFAEYRKWLANRNGSAPVIGRLLEDRKRSVKGPRDSFNETRIDLGSGLPNGVGHLIVVVEPTDPSGDDRVVRWIQSTQLATEAYVDRTAATLYVSDLKDGKAAADVELELSTGATATTSADGIATLMLPETNYQGDYLIARRGADTAILFSDRGYRWENDWVKADSSDTLRWHVFDDRKIYRPGETVSVKGYARRLGGGAWAEIERLGDALKTATWELIDSRNVVAQRGTVEFNSFGAFDFELTLPQAINLGTAKIVFKVEANRVKSSFQHEFRVEEFRRPEYEVTVKAESPAPFVVGRSAIAAVEAKYYSGGALPGAEVVWNATAEQTSYVPPNRSDFTFGEFVPWWSMRIESPAKRTQHRLAGKSDAQGKHRLALDFLDTDEARPYLVTSEARVVDINRQAITSSTTMIVHPSELYVGLRSPKSFVDPNQRFKIESIVTDIDGKAVAGIPVSIVAELKVYKAVKGRWEAVTASTERCEIRSAESVSECAFTASEGGVFELTATVVDANGRRNVTNSRIWVSNAEIEPSNGIDVEQIEMIPGKQTYDVGETAEILINSPVFPAEGVMTVRRSGVVAVERFRLETSSTVLKIPVTDKLVSNFNVQVDLFGTGKRVEFFDDERDKKLPPRPANASGSIAVSVSNSTRRLNINVIPRDTDLEPGGETVIDVAVKDHRGGNAANSEVALVAVDESVLALTGYRIGNPLDSIYQPVPDITESIYSRTRVTLAEIEDLLEKRDLDGINFGRGAGSGDGFGLGSGSGDGSGNGNGDLDSYQELSASREPDSPFRRLEIITNLQRPPGQPEIRIRRNFNALAIFSPTVRTDADGRATVRLKLPDNLTRYRITAVAATDSNQFGVAESAINARQLLMIRPSAPRFLNFGDRAEVPVVIQNRTSDPMTVTVAARAVNAKLIDGAGREVVVPANDRAEIRFSVSTDATGIARFQIGAVSGGLADAAEFAFPVLTPTTTESFATYGTTDTSGAFRVPVRPPTDIFPNYGGLEVATSSTQLQELTDSFAYLQKYPFECTEQMSSRMLATAALRDVLTAFKSKDLPPKEAIDSRFQADLDKLRRLQHRDGGWSFWRSDDSSIGYVTVHVAHALARAKQKGYDVPETTLERAKGFLKKIDSFAAGGRKEYDGVNQAYALYVLDLLGERDVKRAKRMIGNWSLEKLSSESIAWLLPIVASDSESQDLAREMRQTLLNRVVETAGSAKFFAGYADRAYTILSSDRRTDGVVLESLLRSRSPETDDLLPKLVRGMLAGRVAGQWRNTQENVFAMLAFDRYFAEFEKETPDMLTRIWFNDGFAAQHEFRGRTTETTSTSIPMTELIGREESDLIVEKIGRGRLYYRIGLNYAPRSVPKEPADFGFELIRSYEAVDDPADVRREPDGSWTVRAGSRVRVRVKMVAASDRVHVALVDNLPAGFEIINPDLLTSERLPTSPADTRGRWYEHLNMRDSRAEAFRTILPAGIWELTFVVRATTPGNFTVPPAKAEEMYSPEVFGRTSIDVVSIR